jgi:uncharacterized Zn finger protein
MLTSVLLTTSPTKIIEGTPMESVGLTCMQACNTTDTTTPQTVTVSFYAVPQGRSPDNTTLIYSNVSITAGDTFIVDQERLVLGDGDAIWATASVANSVVLTASSVGI